MPFPAAAHARDVLTAAVGRGHGEDDYAAIDRGASRDSPGGACSSSDSDQVGLPAPVRFSGAKNCVGLQAIWDFR